VRIAPQGVDGACLTRVERSTPVAAAACSPPHAAAALNAARARWFELAVLAAALAGGGALRFVNLGGVGLNSDEAVYAAQSGSLARNPHFTSMFPVVRAHPLLMQAVLSMFYRHGVPDSAGRYVAAAFGLATIALVYVLGRVLYDGRVGAIGALLVAVMPYHVAISRQILLDGPMTFFATASLICLALAARTGGGRWLVAAGGCLGLAALSKETAIILLGSAFVFLSVANRMWRPVRFPLFGAVLAILLALTYPLLTAVAGGSRSGQSYLVWQLSRTPNHSFAFYLTSVTASIGYVLVAVAALGLLLRRPLTWRETLLLSWIVVPVLFFEVWPVKGFSYLLACVPAVAVLAARVLARALPTTRPIVGRLVVLAVSVACLLSLLVPAVRGVIRQPTAGLAGAGGTPGGRETGRWIAVNLPADARLLTIGPSMANLIEYYSGRAANGLSVSPNPLHRNPSYQPVGNADAALRSGRFQYVVWDVYSAGRSPTFGDRALTLERRFAGRPVHVERDGGGRKLVVVYRVIATAARRDASAHPVRAASITASRSTDSPAVRQPNSVVIYVGYGAAVLLALASLAWAAPGWHRRRFQTSEGGQ